MSRETFEKLLDLFRNDFTINNLEEILYILVYYCAHVNTFRSLRNTVGLPKSTLCNIIHEMTAYTTKLAAKYIKMPTTTAEFEELKIDMTRVRLYIKFFM